MKHADALYAQGRFDDAKAACLEIVARDPHDAAAFERLGTIALAQNNCDEARRFHAQAARHRSWLRRFWPFNAALNYQRALTEHREHRFATASTWLRRASGPLAFGQFRDLKALATQFALFGDAGACTVEGPAQTRVDFLATDPLPVISLTVNGRGPLNFLIDTGGAELILDWGVVGWVGARMCGAFKAAYAGRKTANTGLGRIETLGLGDLTLRNLPIHVLDTMAMSPLFGGREIHGILGTRTLMRFLSTIDYVNGALILRRRDTPDTQVQAECIRRSASAAVPFWLLEMHCMVAWGSLNDFEPMLLFVDTGLEGAAFTATESVLKRAGVAVDWTQAKTSIGGGGEVRIVEFPVQRLVLGAGQDSATGTDLRGIAIEGSLAILEGGLGVQIGGLISHQFFRNHALTLDFNAMRLLLLH